MDLFIAYFWDKLNNWLFHPPHLTKSHQHFCELLGNCQFQLRSSWEMTEIHVARNFLTHALKPLKLMIIILVDTLGKTL